MTHLRAADGPVLCEHDAAHELGELAVFGVEGDHDEASTRTA